MSTQQWTILVVDDDPQLPTGFMRLLTELGSKPKQVKSADEAIATVARPAGSFPIDIVIINADACPRNVQIGRQILRRRSVPIVLLTETTENVPCEDSKKIPALGSISKDATRATIQTTLEIALRTHKLLEHAKSEERRHRTFIESVHDVVYELSLDGILRYVSPSVKDKFGWNAAQIEGKPVIDLVHAADRERVISDLNATKTEMRHTAPYRCITPSGDVRWVRARTRLINDFEEGRFYRGVLVDVTDSKRIEEELMLSEARLKRAEKIAQVGNWEFDFTKGTVYASEGARVLYGLLDREYTISEVKQIPLPQYRDPLDEAMQGLIKFGRPYEVEFRIRRPTDGSEIDIRSVAEYDGKRNVVFGIIEDISTQVMTQQALRENQAYLKAVLDSVEDAVLVVDEATNWIIDSNGIATRMYGYSREQLLEMPLSDLGAEEDAAQRQTKILTWCRKAKKNGTHRTEWIVKNSKDIVFTIEMNIRFALLGGQTRYIVAARDISIRKQSEADIQMLLQQKDTILHEVHHRIKNNITVIASLLSLQAERLADSTAREGLLEAQRRVRTVATLYEKLYRSSDLQTVDSAEYLHSLVEEISRTINPRDGSLNVERDIDSFPLDTRFCVPLGLIVNELLTNAAKYAFPDGKKGTIGVRCKKRSGQVELVIFDEGVGLPDYVRSSHVRSFGLTIVDALVHQLSGKMEMQTGSSGTTYTILFTPTETTRTSLHHQ